MTLDEIRLELATAHDLPTLALAAAVEQAEALLPDVLRLLELASNRVVLTRPEERMLFYGVHVMAAARLKELYDPLLKLIAVRSADFEWLLCDACLHSLLISSADPESRPPYELLADPAVEGDAKSDLFLLAAWMVRQGYASRDEFIAFLERFDQEATENPSSLAWYGWQEAIALLGLTQFEERVRAGWDAGRLPYDRDVEHKAWLDALHRSVEGASGAARYDELDLAPITDVPATLRRSIFFGFSDWASENVPDSRDPARDIRLRNEEWGWLRGFLEDAMVPSGTMTAECLDGFLSAMAAGAQDIPEEEWWPLIWSETGDTQPTFQTVAQEPYVRELIRRQLEMIRRRLAAGFPHQPRVNEVSAAFDTEEWAIGFSRGLDLRPGTWERIVDDEHAAFGFTAVAMLLPGEQLPEGAEFPEQTEDSRLAVLGKLPDILRQLYAFSHGQPVLPLFGPRRVQKIGRNDPCPCGSGRKYKKCCGAN